MAEAKLQDLIQRLEAATARLEKVSLGKGPAAAEEGASAEAVAPRVTAFDEYIEANVKPFVALCSKLGGDLTKLGELVSKSFAECRTIIAVAALSKKPSESEFQTLLKPLADSLGAIQTYRAKTRSVDFNDHLAGVAEGIKCLEWPAITGTPVSHIKEMVASAQFYTNKVLQKYRKTDQTHVDWVNSLKTLIENLAAYVKEHHTTGLSYNFQGKPFAEAVKAASGAPSAAPAASAPKPPAGGAPAPPPPPPPAIFADVGSAPAPAGGMSDILAQIQSGNLTGGLRKVTSEMKTKNRTDKVSVVPSTIEKKGVTTKSKAKEETQGPAKIELVDQKKWVIENQIGNKEIVLDNVDIRHTVYIYGCKDSLIQIKGKVNSISIDKCQKTGIIHEAVVAAAEVINCRSVQIQSNDAIPTITIDKTDGCTIYLSEKSIDVQIVSSKSSEMNVCVPKGEDTEEIPIPEQFITVVDKQTRKTKTESVSHI